jgi:aryl-alcohol dehydrogenase-like predicted oxidoreductase
MISKVNGLTPFTAVQNFYTYLRDRHEQVFNLNKIGQSITLEFADMANVYQDFNLLAYGPLLKGAYARGEFQPWDEQEARFGNADGKARLACLKNVASELDVSVNQLVLAFVMNTEPGIIPIFGASTKEQFEDNMGVLKIEWTPELAETLYHAGA